MTEHRVATHLGVDAQAYDAAIRRGIPGYAAMIDGMLAILEDALPAEPVVVDLGTGTGALAAAVLAAIPRARVVLVDIDPAMLAVAGERVAGHGARAELRRATFFDDAALPPCDAVVASLALHHVPDLADKRALYARIASALRPGGVFLSGDATVYPEGPEHERIYRQWAHGMGAAGIGPAEVAQLFAQWRREDTYQPLRVELDLLAAAGFARPDCFWKAGAMTVFGGFR